MTKTWTTPSIETFVLNLDPRDAPHPSGDDRYAIYAVYVDQVGIAIREQRRIAETSLEGIGITLRTLVEEKEIDSDTLVGVFDRGTRKWLINPYARGRL